MSAEALEHRGGAGRGVLPAVWRLPVRVAEAQRGRAFLWLPVALASGIGLYFSLTAEPPLALAIVAALVGALLFRLGRAVPVLLLIGMAASGFALAKARSDWAATPLLAYTMGEAAVSGRVIRVDRATARRFVMILAPEAIAGLPPEKMPRRLRLGFTGKAGLPPAGTSISFMARLSPLPTPVMPGGFDYGRVLWFEGIGATGRITSEITVEEGEPSWGARAGALLSALRQRMGARIHAALDEPHASFAEALITGERSAIPPEVNQSLLISGLFHILSISGLHMWLVAGGVFWAIRALLALSPRLALAWPIKKWAAAGAFLAGFFYMLLADSGVATSRAFIMVAVVFFAVMVDRPALSSRNLAIAALAVLALDPQAAVEASFQMSFLAVLGLVAFYEWWARLRRNRAEAAPHHWLIRLARWGVTAVGVSLLTSLIAGFGSSIPAAYHFGRISPYGVLANGLAIPVVGLVVMPSALLSVILMPLGLEALPLAIMARGLDLVIAISDGIAALPGADSIMARPSEASVLVMIAGFAALSLLIGMARWASLPLLALGGAMALSPPLPPDILVERGGSNVAVRSGEGLLVPAHPRRARFSVEKWLRAEGDEASPAEAARRAGWQCSGGTCEARVKGRHVLYLSRREGQPVDCREADVVIADFPLRGACSGAALRIDRFDLWRGGAHAVFLGADGVTVETARGAQGSRPWVVRPEPRPRAFTPRSPQDDRPVH